MQLKFWKWQKPQVTPGNILVFILIALGQWLVGYFASSAVGNAANDPELRDIGIIAVWLVVIVVGGTLMGVWIWRGSEQRSLPGRPTETIGPPNARTPKDWQEQCRNWLLGREGYRIQEARIQGIVWSFVVYDGLGHEVAVGVQSGRPNEVEFGWVYSFVNSPSGSSQNLADELLIETARHGMSFRGLKAPLTNPHVWTSTPLETLTEHDFFRLIDKAVLTLEAFRTIVNRADRLNSPPLVGPVASDQPQTQMDTDPWLSDLARWHKENILATLHLINRDRQYNNVNIDLNHAHEPSIVVSFEYINASIYTLILESISGKLRVGDNAVVGEWTFTPAEIVPQLEFRLNLRWRITSEISRNSLAKQIETEKTLNVNLDGVRVTVFAKEDPSAKGELTFHQQRWVAPET